MTASTHLPDPSHFVRVGGAGYMRLFKNVKSCLNRNVSIYNDTHVSVILVWHCVHQYSSYTNVAGLLKGVLVLVSKNAYYFTMYLWLIQYTYDLVIEVSSHGPDDVLPPPNHDVWLFDSHVDHSKCVG